MGDEIPEYILDEVNRETKNKPKIWKLIFIVGGVAVLIVAFVIVGLFWRVIFDGGNQESLGSEFNVCFEAGLNGPCLSNEHCEPNFAYGVVNMSDRCCESQCVAYNLESCKYLGGKSCPSTTKCTKGVWVTDVIEDGTWVREDIPEGAHTETRRINGTLFQTTYLENGSILEQKEVEMEREEKKGFCCLGECEEK